MQPAVQIISIFNMHEPCVNYAMSDECSDNEHIDSEAAHGHTTPTHNDVEWCSGEAKPDPDHDGSSFERGGDDALVSENQFDTFEHLFNKDNSSHAGGHEQRHGYANILFQDDFEIVTDSLNRECFRFELDEVNAKQQIKDSATTHDRNRTALRQWAETWAPSLTRGAVTLKENQQDNSAEHFDV